jgi:hypothetical protein
MTKQPIDSRPKSLSYLMLAPISFAGLLVIAVTALLYLIWKGDTASGEYVKMEFVGACIEEAKPIVVSRVQQVGLGNPEYQVEGNRLTLSAVLPSIQNAKVTIPKLISRRGILEIRHNNTVILKNSDVLSSKLRLDESGMPETLLNLDSNSIVEMQKYLDQFPNDQSEVWLDDEFLIYRPNSIKVGDEFRLVSEETKPKLRMQQSVDFVILLTSGILPCELTLDSIEAIY